MGTVVLAGATSGSTTLTPTDAVTATITLPSVTGALSIDGPAFRAVRGSSNQTLTNSVQTKLQFNSETFDTASCYDSATNYRFTPNVAGYYQVNLNVHFGFGTAKSVDILPAIFKNGSVYGSSEMTSYTGAGDTVGGCMADIVYLNGSTDYIEAYSTNYDITSSGNSVLNQSAGCNFSACFVRAT